MISTSHQHEEEPKMNFKHGREMRLKVSRGWPTLKRVSITKGRG